MWPWCGRGGGTANVLVRVHSSCFTGDVLHSLRCDCGEQLEKAFEKINDAGKGVHALYAPGRARDRAFEQTASLRASRDRTGHRSSQPQTRVRGGSPGIRDRRSDFSGPGVSSSSPFDQQPQKNRGDRRVRTAGEPTGLARSPRQPPQPSIPGHQTKKNGHQLEGCEALEGPEFPLFNGRGRRFAVIVARFNSAITDCFAGRLCATLGIPRGPVRVVPVPGAFELPLVARRWRGQKNLMR
jgi:hypothetical protein